MTDTPIPDLMSFARQVHSSAGEAGILLEIFRRLGIERGTFCEFGAWDGIFASNCRVLFEAGWSGTFIEPHEERFRRLQENYAGHKDRILTLDTFIRRTGEDSLDGIFRRNDITRLDLLSVDIDSDDLAIWRSLTVLRPRIVVIEFCQTIPFDIRYENPEGRRHSSGALSILEHAESVDYDLIGFEGYNLIFCDRAARPDTLPVIDRSRFFAEGTRDQFFVVWDGTIMRRTRDGQIHEREVIELPHVRAYLLQPVPRAWRLSDDDSPRFVRRRRYFTFMQAFLLRPFAVARDGECGRLLLVAWRRLLGHRARQRARRERA